MARAAPRFAPTFHTSHRGRHQSGALMAGHSRRSRAQIRARAQRPRQFPGSRHFAGASLEFLVAYFLVAPLARRDPRRWPRAPLAQSQRCAQVPAPRVPAIAPTASVAPPCFGSTEAPSATAVKCEVFAKDQNASHHTTAAHWRNVPNFPSNW